MALKPVGMYHFIFYICTYLLLTLPARISSLVAHPQQATSPYSLLEFNLTGAELAAGGAGPDSLHAPTPLTSSWCRPKGSELDLLFSTRGGGPIPLSDLMYAVGVFREVVGDLAKEEGQDAKARKQSLRITSRDIVVTIFDPLLAKQNLHDIHDGLDVLLLCCYVNKVQAELSGTLFNIENTRRFASVAIRKKTV